MITSNKTLLLLETRMAGHRPSYLRRVTQMALKNAMHVVIAMPSSCFAHPVVKSLLESDEDNKVTAIRCEQSINDRQATNSLGMLRREYQCTRFYKEALTKAKQERQIDAVIVTTFDDTVIVSGLLSPDFSGMPWLGIVMKQRFHFAAEGIVGLPDSKLLSLKRHLFVRLLKNLNMSARILTIDESLNGHIASNYPAVKDRIDYIPDPVDDRGQITNSDLRRELGIPDNAFVILAYGSLRKKKGVPPLLDVLHQLPENVHALLVGTQATEIKACVNSEQHRSLMDAKRVHQVDRYIDVSEDPNFFTTADCVWLAYENYFQMSAVMVQAAQYQRPSVAAKNGKVGFLTKKYRTGLIVDSTDSGQLRSAVIKLMNKEFCPSSQDYDAFSTAFSLSAFENTLLRSINSVCTDQQH